MPYDVLKKNTNTVFFCPLTETAILPKYAKAGDAGMDIFSDEEAVLFPTESKTITSGVRIKIPENTVGFVTPRSGLASKFAVTVCNSPGTIDSGYTGELKVIIVNHGNACFQVKKGDRIAQLVVVPFISCETVLEKDFDRFNTDRGTDGFGSSGR